MLEFNEITERKYIVMDGQPFEVVSSHVFRKQQRKPVNQTKLRNLITGKVTEYSFHQSEKAERADIATIDVKYLYNNKGEWWFCEPNDPSKRMKFTEEAVGQQGKYLKENMVVNAMTFNDDIIGLKLPIKVELKVTEAPPNVKGNTAQGGNKQVTLETGAVVNVPMFISPGETIRVNTETGEYVERVNN